MQTLLKYLNFYQKYTPSSMLQVFLLTTWRLLIYLVQYYILAVFFGVDLSFGLAMVAILACYFVQTTLPIPPFVALLARGEIALVIWGFFEVNELSILAASYSLWVINVLLPSLVGMGCIWKLNILKSLGYETS